MVAAPAAARRQWPRSGGGYRAKKGKGTSNFPCHLISNTCSAVPAGINLWVRHSARRRRRPLTAQRVNERVFDGAPGRLKQLTGPPKSPAMEMRLARVPCASPPRAMRDSARPGATARPGRVRRRSAASNPRRKRPTRREERAGPVVAKVYMHVPEAVGRGYAGRRPRHHAQVRVRLATCTAPPASVPFAEDPWGKSPATLWFGVLSTRQCSETRRGLCQCRHEQHP